MMLKINLDRKNIINYSFWMVASAGAFFIFTTPPFLNDDQANKISNTVNGYSRQQKIDAITKPIKEGIERAKRNPTNGQPDHDLYKFTG